jgi:Ca2+-binding RTX toxin-like protein
VLSIFSDNLNNVVTVSRNAAGAILVNGGAVPVLGGTPTVANTALIQAFGLGGNDNLRLDESNGALPATNLFGGAGNDTASGGSGADLLFGQSDNDVLLGRGGNDNLFGGDGNDTLTGGDGDDQVFGESGDDRMIWNPGDDTDLFEGGDGIDTAEVNGGNGAEIFTITANGTRVRFDRLDPAPFSIDIGTSEKLVLNANGGDDFVAAGGGLAGLIALTVDGGNGNDTILGGNGADTLLGGDGDDLVDGNQGDDVAFLGAGNDTFRWDPGDGNDVVEGGDGTDTLLFNGSNSNENFELIANGQRLLVTRSVGNIVMDINDVETIQLKAQGGIDNVVVNDLTGTDAKLVAIDLAATGTTVGDAEFDRVTVNGTNAANSIALALVGSAVSVTGLAAQVTIDHADATDSLVVNALGGNDSINGAALPAGFIQLTVDGGAGNDTINGSFGADTLIGGDGNDSVFGDNGDDVALLGAGNDTFRWAPGDGNDVVEGQDGLDTLVFDGANLNESIGIFANGARALFTRDVASVVMDLDDVETIHFNALGGSDKVLVNDLTGTDVTKVEVDLAATLGGTSADGNIDTVTVNATDADDVVAVASVGNRIVVNGLSAQVTIDHADKTDLFVINGLAGNDLINAGSLAANKIGLQVLTGLGADTVIGSAGNDTVLGGDGDDVALLGAGDDLFVWNPGDDNDVVEGQGGIDTMLFNGANIAENIDISANGGRVDFFRNIATVTMDLNDVETIQFKALGGADTITVNDLTGTDAKLVAIDLAAALNGTTGDAQPDTVIVNGSNAKNAITITQAGTAVSVAGLAAQVTVDHADATDLLAVNGLGGNDSINAATLPGGLLQLALDGGAGNDTVTGSHGNDTIHGGDGDDVLIGGDGDDQVFGEAGDDRMIWNPGDDTDLFEGGDGTDTAEVNGGSGDEIFSVTANGARVRFDRLDPAPFTIDIGTTERLILNAGGGNDVFVASGNLAALIALTIDGGAGNDTLLSGNGQDTLIGGEGDDLVDGNQGNDVAFLGAGNDTFRWDPGDGSDVVEGQAGTDTLLFNGNNGSENFEVIANGERVLATRNVGNIVMDLDEVETIQFATQGGFDNVVVNDLTGTDAKLVAIDLAAAGTAVGDAQFDSVTVNGTNAANNIAVTLAGSTIAVTGLAAQVTIDHADASDGLVIKGLGGNDSINAAALPAGAIQLTVDGGAGNDTINGSLGSDFLLGGDGNDSVFGDNGDDVALLGAGNDVFRWAPGDGNDVVEGQDGTDTLAFDGANISENVDIAANGGRVLFTRNVASVVMDLNDVETIQFKALNGFDKVAVHDLTGTDVKQVTIDLAGAGNPAASDGTADKVSVDGTNANDQVTVALVGAAVAVTGTFAPVTIQHADAFDTLTVNGFGGDDLISGAKLPATAMQLALDGGAGNDTLVGGGASDVLIGGDGDDSLQGGLGNDVALLGAGDDVFGWKAGDGSDVIEGQDGFDRLDVSGSNAVETFDLFANGGRALLFHSAGAEVLDINDVERVQLKALGGADHIGVHDLTGTDITEVAIDLAATPNGAAGDGKVDTVTLDGVAGNDIVHLSLVGDEIVIDGLAAQVTIDHADKSDLLTINGSSGFDFIDASGLGAGHVGLQLFGGADADVIIGSGGNDTITGGTGNDELDGGLGNDTFRYTSPLDGHDVIDNFDGNAAGGQDTLNLDALFDSLGIAAANRAANVSIVDNGATVDVAIDANGNAADGFELTAVTLNTTDTITVGQDVILGA